MPPGDFRGQVGSRSSALRSRLIRVSRIVAAVSRSLIGSPAPEDPVKKPRKSAAAFLLARDRVT
ncbi:MAG: hypothetical protein GVY11_00155 [Gammaproteobacteria bacterium]|jgi:hypothetical protein|nr:hypothetical protein [Gammaproteobacteria bacterium]